MQRAALDTGLIARKLDRLTASASRARAVEVGVRHLLDWRRRGPARTEPASPWDRTDGFQLGGVRRLAIPIVVDGEASLADVTWGPANTCTGPAVSWTDGAAVENIEPQRIACYKDVDRALVVADLVQTGIAWPIHDATTDEAHAGDIIRAPINGRVAKLFVAAGEAVEKGARVAVIEAMKMEHVLLAPRAGTIARLGVSEGAQVAQGALIVELDETETSARGQTE